MNEFDDPQMERLLGGLSGPYPDVNVAYQAVRGRVRAAKRRRAMVAGSAACALLFGGAALALGAGQSPSRLQPGSSDRTIAGPSSVHGGTDGSTTVTASTGVPGSQPTASVIPGGGPGNTSTGSGGPGSGSTPHGSGGPGPSTGPGSTAPATTTGGSPTTPPPTSPPTTLADVTRTFTSIGGTIVVHLHDGTLDLVSFNPTIDFTPDPSMKTSGDRVEVRFRSNTHDSRIRVDLVNGAMQPQITEN